MSLDFINITRVPSKGGKLDFDNASNAHFSVSDRQPNLLFVSGGLPHGTHWFPATNVDGSKLRKWLDNIYPAPSARETKLELALVSALDMLRECQRNSDNDTYRAIGDVIIEANKAL